MKGTPANKGVQPAISHDSIRYKSHNHVLITQKLVCDVLKKREDKVLSKKETTRGLITNSQCI